MRVWPSPCSCENPGDLLLSPVYRRRWNRERSPRNWSPPFPMQLQVLRMGKKPPKRRTRQTVTQTEIPSECPYCGVTKDERIALASIDGLYQSHAELCTALRSAARQMRRLQKQDEQALDKLRKILERATNIRSTFRIPVSAGAKPKPEASIDSPEEPISNEPPRSEEHEPGQELHHHSITLIKFPVR